MTLGGNSMLGDEWLWSYARNPTSLKGDLFGGTWGYFAEHFGGPEWVSALTAIREGGSKAWRCGLVESVFWYLSRLRSPAKISHLRQFPKTNICEERKSEREGRERGRGKQGEREKETGTKTECVSHFRLCADTCVLAGSLLLASHCGCRLFVCQVVYHNRWPAAEKKLEYPKEESPKTPWAARLQRSLLEDFPCTAGGFRTLYVYIDIYVYTYPLFRSLDIALSFSPTLRLLAQHLRDMCICLNLDFQMYAFISSFAFIAVSVLMCIYTYADNMHINVHTCIAYIPTSVYLYLCIYLGITCCLRVYTVVYM